MSVSQLSLLKDSRFLPLFISQFCGCFNDCLMKNAIIMLVSYRIVDQLPFSAALLVLFANGLFVASSVFFGGVAGQIADKYERATLVKIIKCAEIGIVSLACYGFWQSSLIILYLSIALMGLHSTFFGPLKYAILPDHLPKDRLLSANGLIEAGTFIGILVGSLTGGLYTYAPVFVSVVMIIVTIIGFISSLFIPNSNNYNPDISISKGFLRENINVVNYCRSRKVLFLSILGISWFWFIGASFLSQIPILTKVTLGANEGVTNLFLIIFSIGVGFGSFWCGRLLNGEISTKYVFLSAIGMSLFSLDLYFASKLSSTYSAVEELIDIPTFLSYIQSWRILLDLFCMSAITGIYVVPLYAVMQVFSPITYRSRVIAANNILNGLFMVISAVMLSVLFSVKFSIPQVILILCCMNLFVAWYIYKLTPDPELIPTALVKVIFRFLFKKFYKVEVHGMENFFNAGKRVVIIANHISYIDPPLIASFLPGNIVFAINTQVSQRSWVRPFLKFAQTYPVDTSNAMGMKHLIRELRSNKKVVIFPEGRISLTGALMKVYEGPGAIADKANAVILPIRINGAEYTPFSKLKNLVKIKWFPKITITILPAIKFNVEEESDIRTRRKVISQRLYDIMSEMMFETSGYKTTLFNSVIEASKIQGHNYKVLDDINNTELTYRQMFQRCFILGEVLSKRHLSQEIVGVMMPNATATVVTFLAMQAYGIVPAMINFTSGSRNILSGCATAGIKTVYTSRQFISKSDLGPLVRELEQSVNIIYLEDLRKSISFVTKIRGMIAGFFPNMYYNYICLNHNPNQICTVLFTSGTEGTPKAVALSHENINANIRQVLAKLDFNNNDVAFNALPLFHCFGLTGSLLMLNAGVKTFLYPSPLHYRVIPEYFYDVSATIMFTTDTFLNMYAKHAHPYDFYSARYVCAGAEKLKDETRKIWFEKFGVRILEGYGATESSPVVTFNTPMHDKPGSVGRLLPGLKYKLESVEGIENGGKLLIKGPNIMLGYIDPETKKLSGTNDGWYDTGDIVNVDENGYVYILGRQKRFAKIAGEMVSLLAIEEVASKVDGESIHAVIYVTDPNRGEKIILCTTSTLVDREIFLNKLKELKMSELYLPKEIIHLDSIPTFATGKTNYIELIKVYESLALTEKYKEAI